MKNILQPISATYLLRKMNIVCFVLVALLMSVAIAHAGSSRSKIIDFDDELVEGVNRRPLDSLSQISERNKNLKPHLYRKRGGFSTEVTETLQESREQ